MLGCQPLANIGDKWHPSGQRYIKLAISVPPQGRSITVTDYQVTRLEIEVLDPVGETVKSIDWAAAEGESTYMIPVETPGEYSIEVTHFGEKDGETVEATESASFNIGAMLITVVEVTPGQVGTINVVGGTPPTTHTLSGKLVDGTTGAPLEGGVVEFAGMSTTSGGDGSYVLDLGLSSGTVTGTLSIHATGFTTYLLNGISLDTSGDSTATWVLQRIDSSGLTSHSLNLHIYEMQSNSPTATEIPDGTPVLVSLYNENGAGGGGWWGTYQGGYTWFNWISGESCLVSAYVDLSAMLPGTHSFNLIKKNVSLTGANQDLSLYEDIGSEMTISITGDSAGNNVALYLESPNRAFMAAQLPLDGSAQATLHLLNPYGYEGFWSQSDGETTASSAIGPIGSIVNLPTMPSLGPVSPPDYNSLAYDTGTLSVSPVAGANMYGFWLMDADSNLIAIVSSVGAGVALPAWMQTQLAGTTMTVMVYAVDSNMASVDPSALALMMQNGGVAPSVEMMLAMGGSKDLDF